MSNFPKHAERLLLRDREHWQRERDYLYHFSIRDALAMLATGNLPGCEQTLVRVPTQESLALNPTLVHFNCDPRGMGFQIIDLTPRLLAQTVLSEFREIEAESDYAVSALKSALGELGRANERIAALEKTIVRLESEQ